MEYTGMSYYYARKHREEKNTTVTQRLYLLLSQHYDKETVDGLIENYGYCHHCLNKHDSDTCLSVTHNDDKLEQHLRDTLHELKWG
jgi:hypothetical protein